MKFNDEVIKSHKDVLLHYIKSNPELELQALYAIQSLMHKLEHPSGKAACIHQILSYKKNYIQITLQFFFPFFAVVDMTVMSHVTTFGGNS